MCFMLPSSRFVRGCCRPCFKTKTVGAYRIRPPWRGKCTSNDGVMLGDIVSFSPTSGRMRYAPTPVRLITWLNMVYIYTCSIIVVAEYGLHLLLFDANRLCLPTKKSGQHTGVMTAKYL